MPKSIEQVVVETMRNALNYPTNVAVQVMGADMSKPIDAVVAALMEAGYTDLADTLQVGDRVRVTSPMGRDQEGTVDEIIDEEIFVSMDIYKSDRMCITIPFLPEELQKIQA